MNEIWKDIKGFENYQISNFGRVKSKERFVSNACRSYLKPEQILRTHVMKCGYLAISLRDFEQKCHLLKIHRLVAIAFIPNPNNLPDVNHIDGNKENPIASNLEWCTPSENTIHAINSGLRPRVSGRNIERIYQTDLYGNLIAIHENFSDAARKNGRDSVGAIYSACNDNRSYGNCFLVRESDYIDFGVSKCKKKRNINNIDLTKKSEVCL